MNADACSRGVVSVRTVDAWRIEHILLYCIEKEVALSIVGRRSDQIVAYLTLVDMVSGLCAFPGEH